MVTNVPPSLNWKDLKGAFSAAGTIEFCEVSANGKAEITFQTAQAARQAVDTYNGGDLNGRSIKVASASHPFATAAVLAAKVVYLYIAFIVYGMLPEYVQDISQIF